MSDQSASRGSRRPVRALDHRALLEALDRADVAFVVVGAFAVAAHGVIRGTADLDLCPDPADVNLRRLADVLVELDAELVDADEFRGEIEVGPDLAGLKAGGNFRLETKFGGLDVMQYLQPFGERTWAQLKENAVQLDLGDLRILVAGYRDLIRMKRAASRPQDLIDIEDLKAARRDL